MSKSLEEHIEQLIQERDHWRKIAEELLEGIKAEWLVYGSPGIANLINDTEQVITESIQAKRGVSDGKDKP